MPVNPPGFQVYDVAPLPVNVAELPAQTLDEDALALTVGLELITRLMVLVPTHPDALVPVAVYTVELAGLTVTDVPLKFPGFQVKLVAPAAVKVAVFPMQRVEGLLVNVKVGKVFTVNVTVLVLVHPSALEPVTV